MLGNTNVIIECHANTAKAEFVFIISGEPLRNIRKTFPYVSNHGKVCE